MREDERGALEDLEIDLLLEAVFRQYGFDFRGYARSSLRRRVRSAVTAESVKTVSGLLEKTLHDPECLEGLLLGLSVKVSDMFSDTGFFLALRRHAVPLLRT